jgi:FkbM family methyltransferase
MYYYYFNDIKYPVSVTDETIKITPYTFQSDGQLWEQKSLYQFFNNISINNNYNIIDIGAQSGLYSLFAKYLPLSTFYSFEPFPDTFKLLNDNLIINEITNVNTYNLAISDKTGFCKLNTSISHNGLHTLGENPLRFSDIKSIDVTSTTLDDFFNDIYVHYIKIDTEGYEYYILKGGLNIIKKYKPIIQLEYNIINMKQCNVSEEMFSNLINEIDYVVISSCEEELLIGPNSN